MGWSCGITWGYATKLASTPTLATYYNDTGATKVVKSFWAYLGTGNGTYNAGTEAIGKGTAIDFYVTASYGSTSVVSTHVSVTNASTPLTNSEGKKYSDRSKTQLYEVTFGSGIEVPNGGTVSILGSYNDTIGHDTQVLIFYDDDAHVGGTIADAYVNCLVTYHKNDGSGVTVQQNFQSNWGNAAKFGYDTAGNLLLNFDTWTRTGYNRGGWAESSSGSKAYDVYNQVWDSWVVSNTPSKSLYMVWIPHTYTLRYDANTGTGAPGDQIKTYGVALTLSNTRPTKSYTISYNANGGSVSPGSKTVDCTFTHWDTARDGSGNDYAPGASFNENGGYDGATITLYAQWSNPTAGTLPTPTRTHYVFVGWFDAYGNQITDATIITSNITLYAYWVTSKIYIKSGNEWIPWIPPGTTPANVNAVYRKSGSSWTKVAQVRKKSGSSWNNLE